MPYAVQPPEVVPGNPLSYATASLVDGYATGLLVQTREGRPIKIEGNPSHPASLGATGVFEQALLMELYDADRLGGITGPTGPTTFNAALGRVLPEGDGHGLALLLEPTSSPLRARLLQRVEARWPGARVRFHTAISPSPSLRAFQRAVGRPLVARYDLSRARTVVSMDADFASSVMPGHLVLARGFASRRAPDPPGRGSMSRLYVAEPTPSMVTPVADHVLPVRAGDVVHLLRALVWALGGEAPQPDPPPARLDAARVRAWVDAAAADLLRSGSEGLVMVGESQPPAAHLLAYQANRRIGALGTTVVLQAPALERADEIEGGLARLTAEIKSGEVDRMLVLGGDPVYTAPSDVAFGDALAGLDRTLYLGLRENATARRTAFQVPERHLFESWGDARAYDGTLTPIQPLVRPLLDGAHSVDGLLLRLLGEEAPSVHTALRTHWRAKGLGPSSFDEAWDQWWEAVLSAGFVKGTAYQAVPPPEIDPRALNHVDASPPGAVEIAFRPDPCLWDGRFASNPWLQELPDPTTKLSWCNGALVSPALASALGVGLGDPLEVRVGDVMVEAPAIPVPGHVDGAVTLTLGHGQEPAPTRYEALGVNAYRLRRSTAPWFAPGTVASAGGERWDLPLAQEEQRMHDRPIVLRQTEEGYSGDPDFTRDQRGEQPTWYGEQDLPVAKNQWGMSIDLSICTGCSACMVACRAENNVPIVGPEGVRKGRIMDWIRLDAYTTGPLEAPDEHLRQPMLCQHCEDAPCEYVCPVYATVHSDDGLNEMVYNRCVGTRFCSNNCPYKVRRFNWLAYNERRRPREELVLNPDVTVRDRGVMEKCSYCVQRIRRAGIQARNEGRDIAPNEVVTACQQACPTRAIVFGDIAAPDSDVSKLRSSPRRYDVLHELGTRPRTQYLAHIRNPNPDLAGASAEEGDA